MYKTFLFPFIFIFSIFFSLSANAQVIADALRYSTVDYAATGRAIGTGGSFSALGADFSLVGSNPAGLAAFRKSEFVVTPGWDIIGSSAQFERATTGGTSDETKNRFSFGNLGIVMAKTSRSSKWKTFNFGIGFNRIATFHSDVALEGTTEGSITERWVELSNGFFPSELDNFELGLAYDAFAIFDFQDPDGNSTREYQSDYIAGSALDKTQTVSTRGGISEFQLSLATNYNEKLFFGGTLGLPFVNYEEEKVYIEDDTAADNIPFFNRLTFRESVNTSGAGVNLRFGLIYRLNQQIRLGLSGHTRTTFTLDDEFGSSVLYDFTDPDFPIDDPQEESSPEDATFEYRLTTPWKVNGSAGFILGKRGFVSAEVEYIDYSGASFNFDTDNSADIEYQNELNTSIDEEYQSAINTRIGGEYAFGIYRARAGVGLYGAPSADVDARMTLNAGLGFRKRAFFMDLAFQRNNVDNSYFAYRGRSIESQFVQNDLGKNHIVLTFGFKMN